MKLGFSLAANGTHKGGWRHEDAWSGGGLDIEQWAHVARAAERGRIHFMFWADGAAVRTNVPNDVLSHTSDIDRLEPLTLISALSQHVKNIGFIATASTSFNEPYNIARKFASLDYITKGRVGWNMVTGWSDLEAQNFNQSAILEHGQRYRRAIEFYDVVSGLWDGWEKDAFGRDKSTGVYFDAKKMKVLNHKGEFFSVRGPLNIARPLQGRPVVAQAGSSEPGQILAAQTADLVYTAQQDKDEAKAFYRSLKARLAENGRSQDSLLIMPGLLPIVGETDAAAQAYYQQLQELVDPVVGMAGLSEVLGDLTGVDLDKPLPARFDAETNSLKGMRQVWISKARSTGATVRQLYQEIAVAAAHKVVIGSPKTIADFMEEWVTEKACDGFNIMLPHMPTSADTFVDLVIPELQRRNLFRKEYQGTTLRENLGLELG